MPARIKSKATNSTTHDIEGAEIKRIFRPGGNLLTCILVSRKLGRSERSLHGISYNFTRLALYHT